MAGRCIVAPRSPSSRCARVGLAFLERDRGKTTQLRCARVGLARPREGRCPFCVSHAVASFEASPRANRLAPSDLSPNSLRPTASGHRPEVSRGDAPPPSWPSLPHGVARPLDRIARPLGSCRQTPGSHRPTPGSCRQTPGSHRPTPGSCRQTPGSMSHERCRHPPERCRRARECRTVRVWSPPCRPKWWGVTAATRIWQARRNRDEGPAAPIATNGCIPRGSPSGRPAVQAHVPMEATTLVCLKWCICAAPGGRPWSHDGVRPLPHTTDACFAISFARDSKSRKHCWTFV